jgi:hypothetical protein
MIPSRVPLVEKNTNSGMAWFLAVLCEAMNFKDSVSKDTRVPLAGNTNLGGLKKIQNNI